MKYALFGVLIAGCGSMRATPPAPAPAPAPAPEPDRLALLGFLEGDWQDDRGRLWTHRSESAVVVARLADPPSLLVIRNNWFRIPDEISDPTAPPDPRTLSAWHVAEHESECDEQSLAANEVHLTCAHTVEQPARPPITDTSTPDEILSATTPHPPIVIPVAYRRAGDTLVDISRPDEPRSFRRSTAIPAPDVEAIDAATPLYEGAPGVATPAASRRDDTARFAAVVGAWTPSPGTRLAPGAYVRIWRRTETGWTAVAQFPPRQVP